MSIGINKTSKLPKSPLEETSRPVAVTMMRDDTTVPAIVHIRIPAIKSQGAVEMDEIIFIKVDTDLL